jgi:hypothetical protein
MSGKHHVNHVKPADEEAAKEKLVAPFAADESETRKAAESGRRNPDEASRSPLKDDWRTCPNAKGPQPGDFGDRG